MSDHYIASMTNNTHGTFVFACRCGAVFFGLYESAVNQYDRHREEQR
jgi:hypothetical protein